MTRQTSRRQRAERSHQGGSQEASSGAGEEPASIYITRDEMETMTNLMHERMMKSQQEMLQNFFEQMRATGTQNPGPATAAVNVEQGARAMEPNVGQNTEPEGNQQGLGGRPAGSNAEGPLEGAQPARANTNANEPPEEYVPEFPTRLGGQDRDMTRGQPLDGDERMIGLVRRLMRGGFSGGGLEEVSRSPFAPNIRNARNPPKFKLPTLNPYDGKSDPTMHITRYIRHMEVLGCNDPPFWTIRIHYKCIGRHSCQS